MKNGRHSAPLACFAPMTRLTNADWICVHHLSLEVHLARTEQELIDFVLLRVPEALGIDNPVWHRPSQSRGYPPERADLTGAYRDAMHQSIHALAQTITTHPVMVGLETTGELDLSGNAAVSMIDFSSLSEIEDTGGLPRILPPRGYRRSRRRRVLA